MRKRVRLQYNSPVVLTFAILSFIVLIADQITSGSVNRLLFSVYHSSLSDPYTYPRFFLHVLGHVDFSHYFNNIMVLLVAGPALEEKYGSKNMLVAIMTTALVTGLIHWLVSPNIQLLGASGIVFMMIVMMSLSGMKDGCIPITLIIVLVMYVGKEALAGFTVKDNVSQLTHVIGGLCGAGLGITMR